MAAFLGQIARLNPKINAIVAKLPDEECLALADEADRRIARGDAVGPLHGLPFAFKELDPVVGFPMTRGSLIFKDFMPTEDSVLAERLRFAGVFPIGKTNISEFGMGSHSYNEVYGTTAQSLRSDQKRRWFERRRRCGIGGGPVVRSPAAAISAVRCAIRLTSTTSSRCARVSDWCRPRLWRCRFWALPSKGRWQDQWRIQPSYLASWPVPTHAILLAIHPTHEVFAEPLDRDFKDVRVAWCPDLGGLPLDQRVRAVLAAQRQTFVDLGCAVEDAVPDLDRRR